MKETHTNTAADVRNKLEQLLKLDGSLDSALQSADVKQAIALMLKSAQRHRVALDADTLKAHIRSASETHDNELKDEQLSGVAGGRGFAGGLTFTQHADTGESTVWGYQRFRVI